ncbi:G patch domain-containing protein 3 [Halotydeus destructor]|nr:G patch domain-containing protein 3 [Halotydeus destructor]
MFHDWCLYRNGPFFSMADDENKSLLKYFLILNIPCDYRSVDVRSYFSEFYKDPGFSCFHFKHRPQLPRDTGLLCCFVAIKAAYGDEFITKYNRQYWLTKCGEKVVQRCIVKLVENKFGVSDLPVYFTAKEVSQMQNDCVEISKLAEMNPPKDAMPQGNVGTTMDFFLTAIRECRLPAKVIRKLELDFPKSRKNRIYQNVAYEYGMTERASSGTFDFPSKSSWNEVVPGDVRLKRVIKRVPEGPVIVSLGEEAEEEWDRHESLHDDVTEQDRTKQRLYEKELEVTWDKGSSGLVFYTDAQYWDEVDGDFDEKTTDDWDIDPQYADKDGRDWTAIHKERHQLQHKPVPESETLSIKKPRKNSSRKAPKRMKHPAFGRKILRKAGWKDGLGLGRNCSGITQPIDCSSQTPGDLRGLGYRGEKMKN